MRALLRRRPAADAPSCAGGSTPRRTALLALVVAGTLLSGTRGTQDAVANGDTRTLSIIHEHSKESGSFTFKRDGRYDRETLAQLNWLLRDWRLDEQIRMEPKLFDAVWEAYRAVGSNEPIHVVSAYRSPQTNAALRRRSRAVAEHSQHMLGKAMDFYLTDVTMDQVRAAGMRLQNGGVGYYPNAYNPFVHIDAGTVRHWPRMSYDQLARLFPDGRTVHLPSNNQPLSGYDEAKTAVLARGGSVAGFAQVASAEEGAPRSLWQMLFGGGDDEDSSFYGLNNGGTGRGRTTPAPKPAGKPVVVVASASPTDDGASSDFLARALGYAAAPTTPDPLRAALARPQPARSTMALVADPAPVVERLTPPVPAITMPLPPRRPDDLPAPVLLAGLTGAPLPPSRPRAVIVASAEDGVLPQSVRLREAVMPYEAVHREAPAREAAPVRREEHRAAAPTDDRGQLRALFTAAASPTAASGAVRLAAARSRPDAALPGDLVGGAASGLATGFSAGTPGLSAARFSGSSTTAPARTR